MIYSIGWRNWRDNNVEIWMWRSGWVNGQWSLRMNTFLQLLDKRHWFMATKWSMCFLFETEPWWEVWTHLDSWYRLILIYAYSWPWYWKKRMFHHVHDLIGTFNRCFLLLHSQILGKQSQRSPWLSVAQRPRPGARTWSRRIRRSGDISLWWPSTCIVTNCWMTRTNRQQLLNKIRDSTKIQQDACSQGVWMDVAYEIL